VEILVAENADVSIAEETGRTALHCAARAGYKDVVSTLLRSGADQDNVDKQRTPLRWAEIRGHDEIVKLLS